MARGLNIGKQVEIDEQTKKQLLDLDKPLTDKGGIKTKDSIPDIVDVPELPSEIPTEGFSAITPEEENLAATKEPLYTREEPTRDTEIDYSLSPEEFKAKYTNLPTRDPNAITPSEINRVSYDTYGKGMEDYRDYIRNPLHNVNLDYTRAINQSGWQQARRGATRFLFNVIPETVEQGANVFQTLVNVFTPEEDEQYENVISQSMKAIKESVNEEFNIYLANPESSFDVGDSGWWADRLSSLATSATAFVALGYATGGIGLGSKVANTFANLGLKTQAGLKGKQLASFLKQEIAAGTTLSKVAKSASLGKKGISYANIGDAVFNSYLMTSAESLGVASEVYDKVYNEKLGDNLSEETARKDALKAADRAFMFNQWNIALNVTSVLPFLRTKGLKGFVPERTLLGGAKKLGLEGTQESMEELVNLVSEKRATDYEYNFEKALEDIFTEEGAESAFLGFIGGFAQTGLTLSGQFIPALGAEGKSGYKIYKEKLFAQEEARTSIDNMLPGEKGNEWDIFKSTNEQTQLLNEVNKLGNKLRNSTDEAEREKLYNELKEKQSVMFLNQVYTAFKHGLGESFINRLEEIKNFDSTDAEQKEILEKRIEDIKELEKIYNYTNNLYTGDEAFQAMAGAYRFRALKEEYQEQLNKEGEGYLETVIKEYEQTTETPLFDISLRDGHISYTLKEEVLKQQEELETNISKVTKESEVLSTKLTKAEEAVAKAKEKRDTSTNIRKLEDKVTSLKEELETKEKEKEQIVKDSQKFDQEIAFEDYSIENLASVTPSKAFNAIRENLKRAKEQEQLLTEEADDIVSLEGQKRAKKQYLATKSFYEKQQKEKQEREKEIKAEQKRKDKEIKRETKLAKKEGKKPSELIKEEKEEVEPVTSVPVTQMTFRDFSPILEKEKDDITVDEVVELLDLTEEEKAEDNFIGNIFNILTKTDNISDKQDFLIGYLLKQGETLNPNNLKKALELYTALVYKDEGRESYSSLEDFQAISKSKQKEFITKYEGIEKSTVTEDIVNNIDLFSFNLEESEDATDEAKSEEVSRQLEENPKEFKTFENWVDQLLAEKNLTVDSPFDTIIKALIDDVGEGQARKIFYKVQGYIMFRTGNRQAKYFNTIVTKTAQKQRELAEKKQDNKIKELTVNTEVTLEEIEAENKENARIEILLDTGVLVSEDTSFGDKVSKGTKHSTSIAFKTIESKRKIESEEIVILGTGKLSNVDTRLLTQDGIQENDRLSFAVEPVFVDNKGVTFYSEKVNGEWKVTIKDTDGLSVVKTGEEAFDFIPIQVFLDGSPLTSAYIHLPSFINSENYPYNAKVEEEYKKQLAAGVSLALLDEQEIPKITKEDLEQELITLRSLRSKVLNGEEVDVRVVQRKNGFFIETENASTIVNLPNVNLAIYTGSHFKTDNGKILDIEELSKSNAKEHRIYAMIPKKEKGKLTYFPYALYTTKLKDEHREVVKELIRLKLSNQYNTQDKALLAYYKKNGVDLESNSYEEHKNFLSVLRTFVNVTIMERDTDIKEEITKRKTPVFLIRYDSKKRETVLKVGRQKYATIDFNAIRNERDFVTKMKTLEEILKVTNVNARGDILGKNVFIPSIDKGVTALTSYNTFIKENTSVNIKSIKVDGEHVYRIQRSVIFESDKKQKEEVEKAKVNKEVESLKKSTSQTKYKADKIAKEKIDFGGLESLPKTPLEEGDLGVTDAEAGEVDNHEYNLDNFGVNNTVKIKDTVENLKKKNEITGTNEEGKPCKI